MKGSAKGAPGGTCFSCHALTAVEVKTCHLGHIPTTIGLFCRLNVKSENMAQEGFADTNLRMAEAA